MESRSYSINMQHGHNTICVAKYDDDSFALLPNDSNTEDKKNIIEHIVRHYLDSINFSHDSYHYPLHITKIVAIDNGDYKATFTVGESVHNEHIPHQGNIREQNIRKCHFQHLPSHTALKHKTPQSIIKLEEEMHDKLKKLRRESNIDIEAAFLSGKYTVAAPRPTNPLFDNTLETYAPLINKEINESQKKMLGVISDLKQACNASKSRLTTILHEKKEEIETLAEKDDILLTMLDQEYNQLALDLAPLSVSISHRKQQLDEFKDDITSAHSLSLVYTTDIHHAKFLLAWALHYAAGTYFEKIQEEGENRKTGIEQLNGTFQGLICAFNIGTITDIGLVYQSCTQQLVSDLQSITNKILEESKKSERITTTSGISIAKETNFWDDAIKTTATHFANLTNNVISLVDDAKSVIGKCNRRDTAIKEAFYIANKGLESPYFTLCENKLVWSEDIQRKVTQLENKIEINIVLKKLNELEKSEALNQSVYEEKLKNALSYFEERVALCKKLRQIQLDTTQMINATPDHSVEIVNTLIEELPTFEEALIKNASEQALSLSDKQQYLRESINKKLAEILQVTALMPDPDKHNATEVNVHHETITRDRNKSPRIKPRSPAQLQLYKLTKLQKEIRNQLAEIDTINRELAALEKKLAEVNAQHALTLLTELEKWKKQIAIELENAATFDDTDESVEAIQYNSTFAILQLALMPKTSLDFKNRQAIRAAYSWLSMAYHEHKEATNALVSKRQQDAEKQHRPTQTTTLIPPNSRSNSTGDIVQALSGGVGRPPRDPNRQATKTHAADNSLLASEIGQDEPSTFWGRNWREIAIATFTGAVTGLIAGAPAGPVGLLVGFVGGALTGFVGSTVVCVLTDQKPVAPKKAKPANVDLIFNERPALSASTPSHSPTNSRAISFTAPTQLWHTPSTPRHSQASSPSNSLIYNTYK